MSELTTVRQILYQSPNESEAISLQTDIPAGLKPLNHQFQIDSPVSGQATVDNTFLTAEIAEQYIDYVKTKYTPLQIYIV